MVEIGDLAQTLRAARRVAHLGRDLSIRFDGAGGCWISGRCSSEDGEDLSAGTVRRLACDADIIPVVLGSQGEVLAIAQRSGKPWWPATRHPALDRHRTRTTRLAALASERQR